MRAHPSFLAGVLVGVTVGALALIGAGTATAVADRPRHAATSAPMAQYSEAPQLVADAVEQARAGAAAQGVTASISVIDRATGAVLAETVDAGAQVASESIVKLLIAAFYLDANGGFASTPPELLERLDQMLRVSDDATATSLFRSDIVPTVAARYGMGSTVNATDRVGHWGAVRITAHDMTTFLWQASRDPAVGPWMLRVMAGSAPVASDGFDQAFGLNALGGDHGSKQGWGGDSFFTAHPYAVHSVGYTDRYLMAILQTAPGYPDPMRATATTAAQLIQASVVIPPLMDGDFVLDSDDGTVYRLAGGAPVYVSDFAAVPGSGDFRVLSGAEFAALAHTPADGTLLEAGGQVFVVAGGAPLYVADYGSIGGYRPGVVVDPAAVAQAGGSGPWNHLLALPADGTLLQTGPDGAEIYLVAGGAPTYLSTYDAIGGMRTAVRVDPLQVANAGTGPPFDHLRFQPADGTLLQAGGDIYLAAGGAPVYVSDYAAVGGYRPASIVDPAAVSTAGAPGAWSHLADVPAPGTVLLAAGDVFVVAGGAPVYLADFADLGGYRPLVGIDVSAVDHAGVDDRWRHLRPVPADGTVLIGSPGGWRYVVDGGVPRAEDGASGVTVSQASIDRAGQPGVWSHLRSP